MTDPADDVLIANDVVAGYIPDVDVLRGVSIRVAPREIVTILGPNGAGKSTLVKAAFGLVPIRSGSVRFESRDIAGLRPSTLVGQGISYVPQRDNVFPTLSVRENLELGAIQRRGTIPARLDAMYELFPRLRERARQAAGTLSGGERQMVAFARALMPEPRLLLLDEPSAGLAPQIVKDVFDTVLRIRDEYGLAVLLVEQNARQALRVSDRGYVLDTGKNAHEGAGDALLSDPRVGELYLGGRKR